MEPTHIDIKGARVHNLRNVSLRLPRNALICFTGVSGSGKSSLAFDTLYAEGQRRYIESLSSYARQFLGQIEKPDCDLISGLSPSIAIQQKTAGTQAAISITTPGTGTGLIASTTRNGTDKMVSTLGLGAVDITKVLASSRLQTAVTAGGGTFTINGVQISYTDSDSISSIMTRINSSAAGVTASYDSVADQLKLTAIQNGR